MKAVLSPAAEEILRGQTIDEHQPGSILRDFETFLNFTATRRLKAGSVNQLLPLNSLGELNALLEKPLDIALNRPQQKSFPNINGLFLLGRASGLLMLKNAGKEKIFALDEEPLATWRGLNPTGRYFTLLEAWAVRGSTEMLGERRGGIFNETLYNLVRLFEKIPKQGLKVEGNKEISEYGLSFYGLHNIALAEMFGWLEVTSGAGQKGRSWIIKQIKRTAFGDVVIARLLQMFEVHGFNWRNEDFEDDSEFDPNAFDILLPAFEPYFPEWRNVGLFAQPPEMDQ